MRLHFASLVALAVSAQAAYIPITPRSEARHMANQAMGQAGEARAYLAHHALPRSGSGGHGGAGLRKVRRLKRGRNCKPRSPSDSAYASPTATLSSHTTLVDTSKNHGHKSKSKGNQWNDEGDDEWNESSTAEEWSPSSSWTDEDSWMTATDGESAQPTASSTGGQWSESGSSSSASASASASPSSWEGDGDDWSSSSATGSSSSVNPTETGSGGDHSQVPGDSNGGLIPVDGIKLFTTAKNAGTAPGFQFNEMPSEDYDPKTCKF